MFDVQEEANYWWDTMLLYTAERSNREAKWRGLNVILWRCTRASTQSTDGCISSTFATRFTHRLRTTRPSMSTLLNIYHRTY